MIDTNRNVNRLLYFWVLKIHNDCATHCASLWLSDDPPPPPPPPVATSLNTRKLAKAVFKYFT